VNAGRTGRKGRKMKKAAILLILVLLASVAGGMDRSIIDREDLSLKAGPTKPGEAVSLVWLESYVYPKEVGDEKVISLGVRTTAKVKSVQAGFDFNQAKVALTSNDGLYWSGAYKIPDNVSAGLHVVRYKITGKNGNINRTVEFFVAENSGLVRNEQRVAKGEAIYVQSWPLTVSTTCSAMVGASSRILFPGEKLIGVSKMPWYKVVFADGEEGWVSASMVKEPLDEYYMLGYEAYRKKNYSAAIEYYKSTVSIDPTFVKGYFWLAKSYYRKGDMDQAYSAIREALNQDERNIDARVLASTLARHFFEQARAKFRNRRYNEAVVAYQKVLELKPSSALSWIELGKSYDMVGLPLEARSAWREALKIEPANSELHALLNINVATAALAKSKPMPLQAARPMTKQEQIVAKAKAIISPVVETPAVLADDSLEIVRAGHTKKGTRIEAALKSVVALTKSLGTPVVEKGWQAKKAGDKFLVRYMVDQGPGVVEAFEWLVDVDTKDLTASNANSKLLMDRW